jgi:tRNA (guanine-N7-)-methyltransferase
VLELVRTAEVTLDSYLARLDLEKIFGRSAPLQVDLGCGDGSFLCELAQRNSEKNFLGIERLTGRVEKACRKAGLSQTGGKIDNGAGGSRATTTGKPARVDEPGGESINVRVLKMETSYAVRYLLPERSVETFYLLFPDPWPKRRHHRRRIVTPGFLDSIHSALEENGLLRIATDQLDYFQQMMLLAGNDSRFGIGNANDIDLPPTKFERRFRAQGAPIYRLSLRKVSPVT